ncbi:hypothetical protein ACJJTC_018977 [Scirpophaga incertulas]
MFGKVRFYLTIELVGNKHTFRVFRKHAAFHSMIHRLLSVPMSEKDFNEELCVIKTVAVNNGYSSKLIDVILRKKRSKAVISLAYQGHVLDPTSVNNKRWARIPYLGDLSYKCSRTLAGCNPAFYTTRNLSSILCNSKDHTDINQRSGVYELTCATCNKKYIGQTGRSFRIRVAEHSSGWRLNKTESNFAEHLITENHKFDPHENFKALHFCDKGRRLTALETLEINKVISHSRDNILNQQLELSRSPLLHYFE